MRRNGIMLGFVSAVDRDRARVRVVFDNQENVVSDWLPMMYFEYDMPEPGEYVTTFVDQWGKGICLGKAFSNNQPPKVNHGYRKEVGKSDTVITAEGPDYKIDFGGKGFIEFKDGTLHLSAPTVVIDNLVSG